MSPAERAFYTAQSPTSDPGSLAPRLDPLSAEPPRVAAAVAGLLVHPVAVARRGGTHPHAGARDAEVRLARELLRRIAERDDRGLDVPRDYARRLIGTCRHFSLLAASVFRHHGVPARLRVGFATYFVPGFHEDHWLCEYWGGDGWRLLDAQLADETTARAYSTDFGARDVPPDRFLVAGEAWRALRAGAIDAQRCGVSFVPEVRGAWFVAASVLRDLAALNARELLPWDYWGLARTLGAGQTVPPADAARLDEVAALTAGRAPDWSALRSAYEGSAALRVGGTVLSFPGGAPVEMPVP